MRKTPEITVDYSAEMQQFAVLPPGANLADELAAYDPDYPEGFDAHLFDCRREAMYFAQAIARDYRAAVTVTSAANRAD